MKVLVTGGAGYVGSHTAKALTRAGHSVVVLDDLSRGHRGNVKWGPLIAARCGDDEAVREVFRDFRIEAVVHCAAFAYVGESVRCPGMYFENNAVQTYLLLNAMLHSNVRRIVFSSTCATYGNAQRIPIDETHPQNPESPYGHSKLFVERMIASFGHAEGLEWVTFRYFNAAGADPEGELGEEHEPEPHLIPRAILSARQNRPLEVYGSDYPTADGTALRDYVHVWDLADAHVRALSYLEGGGASRAMNLGAGSGATVGQVIRAVESCSGLSVPVVMGPRREGDAPELVADANTARCVLGWKCRYSDLDTIIETAWRWHEHHLHSAADY